MIGDIFWSMVGVVVDAFPSPSSTLHTSSKSAKESSSNTSRKSHDQFMIEMEEKSIRFWENELKQEQSKENPSDYLITSWEAEIEECHDKIKKRK